jgi:hypothetical protein
VHATFVVRDTPIAWVLVQANKADEDFKTLKFWWRIATLSIILGVPLAGLMSVVLRRLLLWSVTAYVAVLIYVSLEVMNLSFHFMDLRPGLRSAKEKQPG